LLALLENGGEDAAPTGALPGFKHAIPAQAEIQSFVPPLERCRHSGS
jgi:hypothetical protein